METTETMTNDTHGAAGKGWYGFDLDGTLAMYDGWKGIDHIGEPITPMVQLMKRMHDAGDVVKIMTARVAPRDVPELRPNPYFESGVPGYVRQNDSTLKYLYHTRLWNAKTFIMDWCLKNLRFIPEITHQKDGLMITLYDDRVKQVVPNEGILVEDMVPKPEPDSNWEDTCAKCMDGEIEPLQCKYYGDPNGCNSPMYGCHPKMCSWDGGAVYMALRNLVDAVHDYHENAAKYAGKACFPCWLRS